MKSTTSISKGLLSLFIFILWFVSNAACEFDDCCMEADGCSTSTEVCHCACASPAHVTDPTILTIVPTPVIAALPEPTCLLPQGILDLPDRPPIAAC